MNKRNHKKYINKLKKEFLKRKKAAVIVAKVNFINANLSCLSLPPVLRMVRMNLNFSIYITQVQALWCDSFANHLAKINKKRFNINAFSGITFSTRDTKSYRVRDGTVVKVDSNTESFVTKLYPNMIPPKNVGTVDNGV